MNIEDAKTQIKNAMKAYFARDKFGNYRIPPQKQRPVFMIGPPGVGKTAIMEQIASEMGVGLVSYSMTHHTRQSALGLPFITSEKFEGLEYRASEYTMSEIIASVYALMRDTGLREGILFLDEINCVSETLAPCMLQFLQYKVFGQHRLPEGWIVVTAGNPPEYNKSVRDFDIVTWDRLKRIDVEPDYEVWKKYASAKGVHPSILTYLETRKKDFYKVESTVDGKNFVTGRGWEDLSEMIRLYEENDIPVDEKLIIQYLQERRIAKDFAVYYDLFRKYQNDYKIDSILAGTAGEDIIFRAQRAPFDERVSFMGLLFDAVSSRLRDVCGQEDVLGIIAPILREIKKSVSNNDSDIPGQLQKKSDELNEKLAGGRRSSSLSPSKQIMLQQSIEDIESLRAAVLTGRPGNSAKAFDIVNEEYGKLLTELKRSADEGKNALSNAFRFCEKAFEGEDEILIFVTELTANYHTARFIGHYGCDDYYVHNKELQFAERQAEIEDKLSQVDLSI